MRNRMDFSKTDRVARFHWGWLAPLGYGSLAILLVVAVTFSSALGQDADSPARSETLVTQPVVGIETGTDRSSLKLQPEAFEVDVPDWYAELEAKPGDKELVAFRVLGLDQEQLEAELRTRIQSEIERYLEQNLGNSARQHVRFTDEEAQKLIHRSETVAGSYFDGQQQVPVEFEFTALQFDQAFQQLAERKWVHQRQESRIRQLGLVSAGMLVLIAALFGGLKLNAATHGYYQGRLQFFVAIMILGIITGGVLLGTRLDWL